ncbi:MAG: AbgT family transporter [Bacteroidales bacterium]|nr:AbgT family transporter [Bacteroidales bacterium]
MKKTKIPHTYVIVFSIVVFSAVLTWFIPGGEFDRHTVTVGESSREVINSDSFRYIDNTPQTWQIFSALFDGFEDKADIIVFILLIGGAFWIMNQSRAIDVGIYSFLTFTKKIEHNKILQTIGVNNIIITLIMLMFSLFGAIFGMSEETIAFVIIFVPLSIRMGYDSIVGVNLCYVAAALGFAGAMLNPFTIGIAQGLSDLPLFSGIEYRFFCWIVINIVGIGWVLRYASKIRKSPKLSPVYEDDAYWRDKNNEAAVDSSSEKTTKSAWITFTLIIAVLTIFSISFPTTTMKIGNASATLPALPAITLFFAITSLVALRRGSQFFVLNLLMLTILFLIVGVMGYGWYVMEIATLFFAMGIAAGMAMNYSPNKITQLFIEGVKDIMPAALVVGLAGGIIIVLQNGHIIDTLLYWVSRSMGDMGDIASLGMMYLFQSLINIVIPSGSAKAALTMPIMSQFSDLIGVSRQATVMAFQFGDGFTNMITPTSGVLIGALGVAKIPFDKWLKWITPFMIVLVILGFLLLIPTVLMELNGF